MLLGQQDKFEAALIKLEQEIAAHEKSLEALRKERESFLIVRRRMSLQPDEGKNLELIPRAVVQRKRGDITKAIIDIVFKSSSQITPKEVVQALLAKGIRPQGNERNFPVTIAKALKRLSSKEIQEHRTGRSVTYSKRS
jgi:hypothetical protein